MVSDETTGFFSNVTAKDEELDEPLTAAFVSAKDFEDSFSHVSSF